MDGQVQTKRVSENTAIFVLPERLSNRFGIDATKLLRDILAQGYVNLLFDCSQVVYIDSSGLSVILNSLRHTRQCGGYMCIFAPSDAVTSILNLSNMKKIIPIFPDQEKAIQFVTGSTTTKILVIDDNKMILTLVSSIFKGEGYVVLIANDGMTGLELAQQEQPDLIICDVMMPKVNGYDVLSTIRQNPGTEVTPFIFLTAKDTKSDLRHGMSLGAEDYLTKPFTKAEITSAVKTQLKKREAEIRHFRKTFAGQ
jgi:anti-anti-sigma factor